MVHWAVPILSYWYHFLTKKAFWLSAICRRLSRLFYLTVVCNALYTYLRESPTLRWRRCFKNPLPSNPKKYILLYMNRIGFKTNVRNGYASGRKPEYISWDCECLRPLKWYLLRFRLLVSKFWLIHRSNIVFDIKLTLSGVLVIFHLTEF